MKQFLFLMGMLCLLLALGPCAQAGASSKKKDVCTIRIHGEGSTEDGEKFTVHHTLLSGRDAYLSIMPLLSEHEVKVIYPFRAADGSGGIKLFLDAHGANLLTEYSIERMGRDSVLAVFVNGREVIDLLVDAPVRDGVFVIPYGLTMTEEAELVNAFPIAGQENSPAQKKKKKTFAPTDIMLPPKASDISGSSAPSQ